MNKVFSFLMVTFAMVIMMTSCHKDEDDETGTYKVHYEISNKGTLNSTATLNLQVVLMNENSNSSIYENVKLDDAKAACNQKISELAPQFAQKFPSLTYTITADLKDNSNNHIVAEWVISCKNGVAEIEQK